MPRPLERRAGPLIMGLELTQACSCVTLRATLMEASCEIGRATLQVRSL